MIELPFILLAGMTGSAHCVGMCGGFVLALGSSAKGWRENVLRQSAFSCGRAFTYAFLGAVAAVGGLWLNSKYRSVMNISAVLAVVAGVFLIQQGLSAAGWWPKRRVASRPNAACLTVSFYRSFLTAPGHANAFVAGVLTGLLPCGLLYGMLALAANTQSLWRGMLVMVFFAVGTMPVMMATGCSGTLLSMRWRQHLLQVAAWCVVLTGVITLARGVGVLPIFGPVAEAGKCPLCP
ncbi:MAG: sulfite exporter TauE/SafE family protein [Pirellulaceae bacterium]|nr:sulfite exporter TauE/SafE family protein [Planctomycetales bacterium]